VTTSSNKKTWVVVQNAAALQVDPADARTEVQATRMETSQSDSSRVFLYDGDEIVGNFQHVVSCSPKS
jgi:hypothetical protein